MNQSGKQKETHRHREQTCGYQGGGEVGARMDWEFGDNRCKLLHLEWINNKVLLYSTGNYIQSPGINHNGKEYKKECRASLVAQWLRICLPMQGTRVRALVWEDPTCRGAAGPVSHNYWACASGACAPQREAAIVRGPRTTMKSGPRLLQVEKALAQKRRPNTAKNK